jgi:hypothetical protein
VELGGAGGAVPGHRVDRLRGLVLQLLPAGRPQLQAQEVCVFLLYFLLTLPVYARQNSVSWVSVWGFT